MIPRTQPVACRCCGASGRHARRPLRPVAPYPRDLHRLTYARLSRARAWPKTEAVKNDSTRNQASVLPAIRVAVGTDPVGIWLVGARAKAMQLFGPAWGIADQRQLAVVTSERQLRRSRTLGIKGELMIHRRQVLIAVSFAMVAFVSAAAAVAMTHYYSRPLHCANHSVLWSVEHGDREQKIVCSRY